MSTTTHDLLRLYADSDALALAALVRKREVSPAELVETAISAIDRLNPELSAVIHRLYDMAREQARSVPRDAPFAGVPFLLKELGSMWQGAPLTNSCAWLRHVVAPADWEQARRQKAAGLILMGKSNAPENGWAITTEPRLYGATHNPWRRDVTPGGSSGGSAAAVASRMVPVAEASDGAGSIRVPASCCGVVGLKPSRGRITLSPFSDFWYGGAYFLCHSRSVRDTAAYLDVMAGGLPGEPYTPPAAAASWRDLAECTPSRLRIGFTVTPPDGGPVAAVCADAVRRVARTLEQQGHAVEEHDLKLDWQTAWSTYTRMTTVLTAGLFDALTSLAGRPVAREDVEPVTWAIIERGRAISGVQHAADIEAVRIFARQIATSLATYDAYVTPVLTQPPRPLGYWDMSEPDLDRYNAKWTDPVFMAPFNMSGQPAISLPLHWSADGLPIGVQIVGRYGDEACVVSLARLLEQLMPWRDRRPPVSL